HSIWTSVNNNKGLFPISVATEKITSFAMSVELKCRLIASKYSAWQQEAYNEIMRAYNEQLQAYNDAQAVIENTALAIEAEEEKTTPRNPLFNSEIIENELKRICIEMITKPFGIQQGKAFYQNAQCDVPQLQLTEELDSYSSTVKFFEQAFDWQILSYHFYPYYWAKKCDWKNLFQIQESTDHIFK